MQPFHPRPPPARSATPISPDSLTAVEKESHIDSDTVYRHAKAAADIVVKDYEGKRDK